MVVKTNYMKEREKIQGQIAKLLSNNIGAVAISWKELAGKVCDLIDQTQQSEEEVKGRGDNWIIMEYRHKPTSSINKPVIINSNSKYWEDAKNNVDGEYTISTVRTISPEIYYHIGDTIKTIYNVSYIIPMVIESIEIDENAGGGLVFKEAGRQMSIKIAKKVDVAKHVESVEPVRKIIVPFTAEEYSMYREWLDGHKKLEPVNPYTLEERVSRLEEKLKQ